MGSRPRLVRARRPIVLLLACSAAAAAPGDAATPADAGVPPLECVRLLRGARIAEMDGDGAKALALLDQAAERFPDELIPLQELVNYSRRFEMPAARVEALRTELRRRLATPGTPLPSGTLRFLMNTLQDSAEDLEALLAAVDLRLAVDAADPDLLEAAYDLEQQLDRPQAARDRLARVLAVRPVERLQWAAFLLDLKLEHWEEALSFAAGRMDSEQPSPFVETKYLQLLARLGRYDELVAEIDRRAIGGAFGRNYSAALTSLLDSLAWELHDHGQPERAEDLWRRILAADPERADVRKVLLYLYSDETESHAHQEALAEHRAQLTDPDQLLEEGTALLAAGDAAAAFDLLARAAPQQPDSEMAWYNLGLAAYHLERWQEVADAFGRAIAINPDRAESFFNRGIALRELGRCREALAQLDRALALDPGRSQVHYYRSFCLQEIGDAAGAREAMERYRKSQP